MATASLPMGERLRRMLRGGSARSSAESAAAVYEELLYLAGKTQSLEELLTRFPEQLCAALQLSAFHVFLRERNDYVLFRMRPGGSPRIALPASSFTVLRMKRDRKPAVFVAEGVEGEKDGWQMLAPESELHALEQVEAQVLVPLEGRTGLMGFATLSREGRRAFSEGELGFLRDLGPQMGRGLETAQMIQALSEQAAERVRVTRELELAREVQEGLLPRELPAIPGMEVAAAYRSAAQIGGDYYDVLPVGDGYCLVVADVSGKGVAAALLMAALRASLHTLVLEAGVSVTALAERLNRLLYKGSTSSRYATVFLSVFEPGTRTLRYVNAGHNPPLVLRADGRVERLTEGGLVAGLMPEAAYVCGSVEMEAGDVLAAYTDGVTEATNAKLEEWGEERLLEALLAERRGTAGVMVDRVMEGLNGFVQGAAQNDDITLVVLRGL